MGGVVVLVLIAFAIWFLLRRKGSKGREAAGSMPDQLGLQEKYGTEVSPERSQLDGEHGVVEMDTAATPGQLADQHGVSELAG